MGIPAAPPLVVAGRSGEQGVQPLDAKAAGVEIDESSPKTTALGGEDNESPIHATVVPKPKTDAPAAPGAVKTKLYSGNPVNSFDTIMRAEDPVDEPEPEPEAEPVAAPVAAPVNVAVEESKPVQTEVVSSADEAGSIPAAPPLVVAGRSGEQGVQPLDAKAAGVEIDESAPKTTALGGEDNESPIH